MDNTHEWCAEGVTPHKPELRNLPTETFSWFFPRIADFETVTVPDREELPPEANHLRTTLASGNIRSIVTIPLTKAGEVVGFIGFDWLNEAEAWSEGTIDLLEVTGNIIANALARKKTIAERNERERELERAKTIIENTTAIIYVKDLDGRYTLVNSRYEEVLGMDREEILGKTDFDFQSEEYARQVRENDLRAVETESPIEVEEEAFRGGEVWTYISVKVPIFDEDGDPTAVCGISTDITERNERERELERKNERLDEFASLVSHDLRNPLNTLELSLELAQRTGEEDHYERCHRAVDRMNTLIDDLLTLAREGEQIDDTEPIGMPEAVKMAWTTVETCGVDLSIETESMIEADRGRLTQLLENLFRNAVEHGSTNPPSQAPRERIERGMTGSCSQASEAADSDSVNVTITVGDLDGGFYVEDDGPGIPESERDEVFESGYSTSDSGTGFGLVIVKRIAEAHGWDVAVTEGVSGGARFEITNVEYPNQ
jgi:PAS domain S-box-containing protein